MAANQVKSYPNGQAEIYGFGRYMKIIFAPRRGETVILEAADATSGHLAALVDASLRRKFDPRILRAAGWAEGSPDTGPGGRSLPAVRFVRDHVNEEGLWRVYADGEGREAIVHACEAGSRQAASMDQTGYRARLSIAGYL